MTTATNEAVLRRASSVVSELQEVDFAAVAPADQVRFVRALEVLRRKLEHACVRVTGLVDAREAFRIDGHRNARDAIKHLGRLTGGEALGRMQSIRALSVLPGVESTYASGRIP